MEGGGEMQGHGTGLGDHRLGDKAVRLQNDRTNPQILPNLKKTYPLMGSEAAHFVWGDLKVFYWSPLLMDHANMQPGNVASKPSLKLSLPKKAQVKCCECFSIFLQGLFLQQSYSCFQAGNSAGRTKRY